MQCKTMLSCCSDGGIPKRQPHGLHARASKESNFALFVRAGLSTCHRSRESGLIWWIKHVPAASALKLRVAARIIVRSVSHRFGESRRSSSTSCALLNLIRASSSVDLLSSAVSRSSRLRSPSLWSTSRNACVACNQYEYSFPKSAIN